MKLEQIYEESEWNRLEGQLQALYPDWSFSLKEMIERILEGNITEVFEELITQLGANFWSEIAAWRTVFITIATVILISAVFSGFKDAFHNGQMADIAFYVNYLILIILFTNIFQAMLQTAETVLKQMIDFMTVFFPAYFLTLGIAAGIKTGVIYYQIAGFLIYGVQLFLVSFLLPAISAYLLFSIMNGIWKEEKLELLLGFLKKGIQLLLKLLLSILTGAGLLQSMITPVLERVKGEAAYKLVESVPGVGELTEGALRMWLGSAVLIKNSIGIVGCIFLFAITAVPLFKIAVAGFILKGMAAVFGIVGEKKMIRFTNCIGDTLFLLLQTVGYGVLLFFVLIAITAYTTNGGF